MSRRTERIDDLIRAELSDLILRELRDPRVSLVTVTRVEITGDRAKKKFIVRHFHLAALTGVSFCNQPADKVEAAKTEIREWPREVKRYD